MVTQYGRQTFRLVVSRHNPNAMNSARYKVIIIIHLKIELEFQAASTHGGHIYGSLISNGILSSPKARDGLKIMK
jgi:hypothetical protein